MIEKVNPSHPDKIADRIAGALVDYAYKMREDPKVAFEVLIGHGKALIIAETTVSLYPDAVREIVHRIAGKMEVEYLETEQDVELNTNQRGKTRAGDNGIFKGVPVNKEVKELSDMSRWIYAAFPTDGKYILSTSRIIVCQSSATPEAIVGFLQYGLQDHEHKDITVNPLGYWTGGTDVDTGATNRKLGSDMGEAVTGGGLHGKDLSKADVAVNIYAHLKAQETGNVVEMCCAIGDESIDGTKYSDIVAVARKYVKSIGGFEKLAEWGLV